MGKVNCRIGNRHSWIPRRHVADSALPHDETYFRLPQTIDISGDWRLSRLTEPTCEMSAGADVVATELVHVDGLPFLGSFFPIRRNALGFFSRMCRQHADRAR